MKAMGRDVWRKLKKHDFTIYLFIHSFIHLFIKSHQWQHEMAKICQERYKFYHEIPYKRHNVQMEYLQFY